MPREAALRLGRKHVPSGYPRLNSLSTATAKLAGPPHPPAGPAPGYEVSPHAHLLPALTPGLTGKPPVPLPPSDSPSVLLPHTPQRR